MASALWTCRVAAASCCLWGTSAWALDPAKAVTQYVSRAWQTEDGLPQVSVLAVLQTRDGYIWFGTQEGLVRFDGVRFHVFDRTNTPALRHNYVASLYEDSRGTLWIGTYGGGLARRQNGTITAHDVGSKVVWAIAGDAQGAVWVATGGGGLTRVTDGGSNRYTTRDGLPSDTVLSLSLAPDGALWIGTASGLSRLEQGRFSNYTTADGLPHDIVTGWPADRRIRLPMVAGNRSVNLSNAVAVVVFEAWRQLGYPGSA